ncbi:MAG: hypothetical protein U0798_13700 [Gemmataceae bacterium]
MANVCHTSHTQSLVQSLDQSHVPPAPVDDHVPGCPASIGADQFKWVEPAGTFAQAVLPAALVSWQSWEMDLLSVVRSIPSDAPPPSSSPLYVMHCSLVI